MNVALTYHAQRVINDLINDINVFTVFEEYIPGPPGWDGRPYYISGGLIATVKRDDVYVGRLYLRTIGNGEDPNDPNGAPYVFSEEDEDFAHPPAPPAPPAPQQMGGSLASLRILCNQRGMSCRDTNGKLLPKSKLIKLLRL